MQCKYTCTSLCSVTACGVCDQGQQRDARVGKHKSTTVYGYTYTCTYTYRHKDLNMYTCGVQTHFVMLHYSTAWTCVPPSTTYIHIHTITCVPPLTLAGLASQECLSAAHTCCGWACCPLGGRCRGLCTVLCCWCVCKGLKESCACSFTFGSCFVLLCQTGVFTNKTAQFWVGTASFANGNKTSTISGNVLILC